MSTVSTRRLAALTLLAGLAAPQPAGATLIQVWSNADDLTINGNCSLREAVAAAQTNQAIDECPAGSAVETDVVQLAWGPYDLNLGQLEIGPGAVVVRGAATPPRSVVRGLGSSRLFEVQPGAEVTFEGLDLEAGDVRSLPGNGGAVYASEATVAFDDVVFRANRAAGGGALYASALADQTVTLTRCRFEQNLAEGASQAMGGAAKLNLGGTARVAVEDTDFVLNQARTLAPGSSPLGGAFGVSLAGSARLDLERVRFVSNQVTAGSADGFAYAAGLVGLLADDSILTMLDSAFVGNHVPVGNSFSVSALYVQSEVAAEARLDRLRFELNGSGALYREIYLSTFGQGAIRATNWLVAAGPATGLAAYANDTGQVDFGHLTVTGHSGTGLLLFANGGAHLEVDNSIAWANGTNVSVSGPAVVGPSNLVGVDPSFVDPAGGDYRLAPGSVAIDHGDSALATVGPYDVAHAPRLVGLATDAGAYEFGALFGDGFESGDVGAWSAAVP